MRRNLLGGLVILLLLISTGTATSGDAGRKVIVYYLYFTPRCETCLNMEAFAKEAVETGFPSELKDGTVEWHSYDTGKDEYKHFWDDFKLETKSLILVDVRDGKTVRWKNCEQIWELAGAKPDFLTYVQKEVRSSLRGESLASDSAGVQTTPAKE